MGKGIIQIKQGTATIIDAYTKAESDARYFQITNNLSEGTKSTLRTNIGATATGSNVITVTDPGAITFLRINADNSASLLSASDFRTAIGAGSGTVTSVSGTTDRITSSGGTTPVIDIAATYVGQTSITTLGTIATGAWNATVITGQYGGTGVANTGKTLTLGATLVTTGTLTPTLAFPTGGSGTYTFPSATSTLLANNLGISGGTTLIGGTAAGDVINIQGTSGTGTSTVAAINFLVGTNGGTTAAKIYNTGTINIGNKANPASAIRLVRLGQDTAWADVGSNPGNTAYMALWLGATTPSNLNYAFSGNATECYFNSTNDVYMNINNTTKSHLNSTGLFMGGTSNATAVLQIGAPSGTGANTSPFKLTNSGTNILATGEEGAMEYGTIGGNKVLTFCTSGTTRQAILTGTQSALNVLGLTAITQLVNQIAVRAQDGNLYYIPCSAANTVLT